MAVGAGLGGHRALAAGHRRTAALIALLLLAVSASELQRLADYVTLGFIRDFAAFRSPFGRAMVQGHVVVTCMAPLIGGVLIDLYGVRRTVALTIIGWCAVVSAGVGLVDPLPFRLGTPLADGLVPGVLLCAAYVTLVQALDPRRRGVAAMVIALFFVATRERPHLLAKTLHAVAPVWQQAMFLLVAAGAFAATIWLAAFQDPPRAPARAGAASRWPDLPTALCIVILYALVVSALPVPRFDLIAMEKSGIGTNLPPLVAGAVALAAAFASDRQWRRFGVPPRARRVVLLPGFALAAFVGLVGLLARGREPQPALTLVAAVATGLVDVAALLAFDAAPRQAPGLFVGLALTAEFIASQYAGPFLRSLLPADWLLLVTGLAGAASSGLLLRRPRARSAGDRRGQTASEAATGEQHGEGEQRHADAGPGQPGVA